MDVKKCMFKKKKRKKNCLPNYLTCIYRSLNFGANEFIYMHQSFNLHISVKRTGRICPNLWTYREEALGLKSRPSDTRFH